MPPILSGMDHSHVSRGVTPFVAEMLCILMPPILIGMGQSHVSRGVNPFVAVQELHRNVFLTSQLVCFQSHAWLVPLYKHAQHCCVLT